MQQIRVAVIGTGFGAKVLAPWLSAHQGYDVRAIASVHRGDAERIHRDCAVARVYTDPREMLAAEDLDLVVIASASPVGWGSRWTGRRHSRVWPAGDWISRARRAVCA